MTFKHTTDVLINKKCYIILFVNNNNESCLMMYLSTHSVVGTHSLLLVRLLTSYASPHGDRTTLGFQKVVALTNMHGKKIHIAKNIQSLSRQSLNFPSHTLEGKKFYHFLSTVR